MIRSNGPDRGASSRSKRASNQRSVRFSTKPRVAIYIRTNGCSRGDNDARLGAAHQRAINFNTDNKGARRNFEQERTLFISSCVHNKIAALAAHGDFGLRIRANARFVRAANRLAR